MSQPFAALSRQEMAVRKLLSKFHDNAEQIKRNMGQAVHGFDPHRAERTRIKTSKAMTPEELQWMSIDRTLHPEVFESHLKYNEVAHAFLINRYGHIILMRNSMEMQLLSIRRDP